MAAFITNALPASKVLAGNSYSAVMLDGAGVRTDETKAIRFQTLVPKTQIDALVENDSDVQIVTIITLAEYLDEKGLNDVNGFTADNLTANQVEFKKVVFDESFGNLVDNGNYKVPTKVLGEGSNEVTYYSYNACVYNVKDQNVSRDFSARSYITVDGGEPEYLDYNAADNSRSIAEVAVMHLRNNPTELENSEITNLKNIISKCEHSYVDGACSICDSNRTEGIHYYYDNDLGGYVAGDLYTSKKDEEKQLETCYVGTDNVVYVRATYNDGINGEDDVVALGRRMFRNNDNITKVYLPNSIKTIYNAAFSGCDNLTYVDASGVSGVKSYADTNGDAWFNGCVNLETVIFGANLDLSGNVSVFDNATAPTKPKLNIYLSSSDGALKLPTHSNNLLSGRVYNYDENDACGTWKYNQDKTGVVVAQDHSFVDGVCINKNCGEEQTKGLTYTYDATLNGYVMGTLDSSKQPDSNTYGGTAKEVYVRAKYNDGTHGEKDVVAIGRRAFRQNTNIERVYLPKTIYRLGNACFNGCTNLKFVDASGVTNMKLHAEGNGQFNGCVNLATVIFGAGIDISANAQVFDADNAQVPGILDICFYADSGELKSNTYDQRLLSGKIYYYDEDGACGTWKYNSDKTDVIKAPDHTFEGGICVNKNCGKEQTAGIPYYYDSTLGGYVVGSLEATAGTAERAYGGSAKEIYVRAKYNDGTNGEKDVVAIGRRAFRQNTNIEKVYLPSSVTKIGNAAFSGCSNLTYVDGRGVIGRLSDTSQFASCNKLTVLVLGANYVDNDKAANAFTGMSRICNVYLSSADGEFSVDLTVNTLLTGNVYYYSEETPTDTNKTYWHYDESGMAVLWKVA